MKRVGGDGLGEEDGLGDGNWLRVGDGLGGRRFRGDRQFG